MRALLAAAMLLPVSQLMAQAAPAAGTGRVRGFIYDSLSRRPLEGATVFVNGVSRFSVTDAGGRFEIDSVPVGRRVLTYSTPALDSLGFSTLGAALDVVAGRNTELTLGTPSFATVWTSLCANARVTRADSGIMFGSIIDAGTDAHLAGARIVFTWNEITKQLQTVMVDRPVYTTRSDSIGNYYACGLPVDLTLAVDVSAATLSSGPAETMLPRARVMRRDFLVSSEMYVADSVRRAAGTRIIADGLGVRRRGTALLRGEVRNAKGDIVADAMITLPSADTTVRTGADGRFTVAGLPSGSQPLRVRKLGNGPLATTVDLRPGRETDVMLQLPPATVLASVNVRADRPTNQKLIDFEERKRAGFGHFLSTRDLATKPDLASAMQVVPSITVQRRGSLANVFIEHGSVRCGPNVFLDGKPSSIDEVSFFKPQELYGIEVYPQAGSVPAQYQTLNACGAILVWTRDPR